MPPCTPTPRPGRRRYTMWPAVCTAARRRLVQVVLGHRPWVLVEVDTSGPVAAMRVRAGGGVDTVAQLLAVLTTATEAFREGDPRS